MFKRIKLYFERKKALREIADTWIDTKNPPMVTIPPNQVIQPTTQSFSPEREIASTLENVVSSFHGLPVYDTRQAKMNIINRKLSK